MLNLAALVPQLADDNRQNKNAANAGDGPKHAAWLACLSRLHDRLELVIETHAGGGIYQVPTDAFCVALGEGSLLDTHQRASGLPSAPPGSSYYSASGDQALAGLPAKAKYVAFDKEPRTASRLVLLAQSRQLGDSLESRPTSFKGNGNPATSVSALLAGCRPEATLLMVDPFGSGEFSPAREAVSLGVSTVVFGARTRNDPKFEGEWVELAKVFASEASALEWTWEGSGQPGQKDSLRFYLLVGLAQRADAEAILTILRREHEMFQRARAKTHSYVGTIRSLWST